VNARFLDQLQEKYEDHHAQYLYAEMTLKDTSDDLTGNQLVGVRRWSAWIRGVARQEMGHLATVLNLLEAIGGGSHLNRLRFPSPTGLYTPPIPFTLEPLTLDTIQRFVNFEMPTHPVALGLLELAPEKVVVQHVGQLYEDIKAAIMGFDEAALFIGRGSGQDRSTWGLDITVSPVTSRDTAAVAIDSIVREGEGNSNGTDQSHYGRFKAIQKEYQAELTANRDFLPYRNVLMNPATLEAPDPARPETNMILNPDTKSVAELFNACYTTLLLTLVKYYRFDETSDNQDALQGVAKSLMMNVLAKLGPLLSQLPANESKNAGPPFEIYTLPCLPNDRDASLKILRERLEISKSFVTDLATRVTRDGILQKTAQQLDAIAQAIPS
jgi:Ferritin-like